MKVTIDRALLEELVSNCKASIVEDGISDARRVYRDDLHFRANQALQVDQEVEKFMRFANSEDVSNDIEGHPV